MDAFICTTCGTQYAAGSTPPAACTICSDARQYVPASGQSWTTLPKLRQGHHNYWRKLQPDLYAIATNPKVGIGQRAMLVRHPEGNVLWDCISLIDEATVDLVNSLGGLSAVAISHPHYYTTMVEWAREFGCPVWLHEADRQWVMREDPQLRFWSGDTMHLHGGIRLLRLGGHFDGGTVLHWPQGNGARGTLLSGDILQVAPDRRHVSFMWSYPNYLPLPAFTVREMQQRLGGCAYEAVYGAFWDAEITQDGKAAVLQSFNRYLAMLERGALE